MTEYEVPQWNPTLPPPPGFTQNPWESYGSPPPPGHWNWDGSGLNSPWNLDSQRPLPLPHPSNWNWDNQFPPPPWNGPNSFGNVYPTPFPAAIPYFHQPPFHHSQGQSHSPSSFNGTTPQQDGLATQFSTTSVSGSGSSLSSGCWSETLVDVGETNVGTMQIPTPASGNPSYRSHPGIIPISNQPPRWPIIGRGIPGPYMQHPPGTISRGSVGRGTRPTTQFSQPGSFGLNASSAASLMSYYYNNSGPLSSCGPSTEALFAPGGLEHEKYENESIAIALGVGTFSSDNSTLTGSRLGDRQVPKTSTEKGQGDRSKSGYRMLPNMSITHILCSICCKKNGRLCTACGHVAYCGQKCQKADWDRHKYQCMPASMADKKILLNEKETNSGCKTDLKGKSQNQSAKEVTGSQYNGKLMARRKIKKGETVLHLQPVMMACNDKGLHHPPDSVLCLSCCKWYQSSQGYRCSKCRWPVCSVPCEQNPLHSNYECSVFASKKLSPPLATEHTQFFDDAILALRCLLLKTQDPPKFEELFEWKDICSKKKRTPTWAEYDERILNFLTKKCEVHELLEIKVEALTDYLKVIDFCSLMVGDRVVIHANEFGKSFFCAKYVFPSKMLVTEECSPNCKWSMKHSSKLEECSLRLHSTLNIDPASYLTASFSKISDFGASFPRRYNSIRFDTVCDCKRCIDPTELGSFFSGVKCQECESEADGFLLPLNPADPSSEWQCHNSKCNSQKMKGSFILQDINNIHNEMDEAGNDYWALVDLIWKYEKRRLHPNHFLILKAATVCVELFWGSVRGLPFYSPRYDFFNSCINLANRAITILDIISPGASIQRARILFQIQVAYAYKNLRDFRRYLEWGDGEELKCIPKIFWEVQKIQEEAYEVLLTEPYGSLEHEMSVVLQEVIEDQVDLLCHTPTEIPLEYTSIYNLHKIYSRFSNEFYYPAIPIYEDKDIHDFVISTGSCARHLVEKINYTI